MATATAKVMTKTMVPMWWQRQWQWWYGNGNDWDLKVGAWCGFVVVFFCGVDIIFYLWCVDPRSFSCSFYYMRWEPVPTCSLWVLFHMFLLNLWYETYVHHWEFLVPLFLVVILLNFDLIQDYVLNLEFTVPTFLVVMFLIELWSNHAQKINWESSAGWTVF